MRRPLVTSHAACKGHAPENTLAGIEAALRLGVDAIEIDVHATADGVPVLLHDDTVDRTTDGRGDIRQMTFERARSLDAGAKQFVPQFHGARIPSLAEVLDLTRGKALLQIEIKEPDIEPQVAAVVRAADAISDCEVHSFGWRIVKEMRAVEPRMAAMHLTDSRRVVDWEQYFGFVLSLHAQGVSVHYTSATPERVRAGQRRGLTFMVWTVDEERDIAAMVDAGADSICSNFPDVVSSVLESRLAGRR
jgi:glycerophosphoryl diester phosphodiesterase